MTSLDVRGYRACGTLDATGAGLPRAPGRQVGEDVPAPSPTALYTLTRGWNPEHLPVLAGAGGWQPGAA